jgi:hypothetical protein
MLSTFWDVIWGSFIIFFVFIPLLLLWFFALADLFMRKNLSGVAKVVWLLVIIFIPILGPLIYMLVRPQDDFVAPGELG